VKHDLTYIHPYPASVTSKYPIAAGTVTTAVRHVPAIAGKVISNGQAVLNELVLLLLAIGVITLLLRERTLKAPERAELAAFALGCAVLLAVLRFSGTISQLYNAPRGQVQGAPLLGVATALVATWLFERRHAGVIYVAGFAGALSLMLFADSGFADFALTGKGVDTISNSGEAYQENDITAADVASAEWVVAHHRPKGVITYTDVYGELQIYRYSHLDGVVTAITPDVLEPNSWIYATSTNIVYDTVRDAVGDGQVTTKLPTAFLNRETNLVFTTGTTRIYY
jgi:uncharacterized membrane protein